MFSKTTARPRCCISAGVAADGLMHRAVGREVAAQHGDAALRRSAALSSGRITSSFQFGASLTFSPDGLAVDGQRVAVEQAGLAERAHHRRQAAGVVEILHQEPARRHQVDDGRARRGRAGPSRRASRSTPRRPAIASRWMTALVEPPIAPLTRMAFSKASRVRICDTRRSSLDHLDDAPAGHVRQHVAARIDGRDRGVVGQADAQRFDHQAMVEAVPMVMQWPAERDMPLSAAMKSSMRHLAGLHVLGELPDVGARADVAGRGTCRSASARRRRRSSAGRSSPRPSAAPAWSCRSRPAARRRRSDWRGSIPRHPCWRGCGTAWPSAAGWISPSDITGNSSGKPPASQTPRFTCSARSRKCALQGVSSDQVLQMPMTGRPSNSVVGQALVLHPAAVDEAVARRAAEPVLRAQLLRLVGHAIVRHVVVRPCSCLEVAVDFAAPSAGAPCSSPMTRSVSLSSRRAAMRAAEGRLSRTARRISSCSDSAERISSLWVAV